MIKRYIRSYTVEAIQLEDTPNAIVELFNFTGQIVSIDYANADNPKFILKDRMGVKNTLNVGDYIFKDINGLTYFYTKESFERVFSEFFK